MTRVWLYGVLSHQKAWSRHFKNEDHGGCFQDDQWCSKVRKNEDLPDLRGVTIGKFAKKNIAEFSRVETDNYRSLRKPLAEKYFHSYETFAPDKNMLKWLHAIISNAKAFVEGTYHGMERKHVQLYLDEFCYRFNRRSYHENLFERLALACVNCPECRLEKLLR